MMKIFVIGFPLLQSHFLANGSTDDGQWILPLTICCNSYENQKKILLKTKSDKLDLRGLIDSPIIDTSSMDKSTYEKAGYFWIKFNVDQTGFYRVKYDTMLMAALTKAISQNKLSSMDKYGNINAILFSLLFSI